MTAIAGGLTCYGLLLWMLGRCVYAVIGAPPLWVRRMYHWKWNGTVRGFFTVRYEIDDEGLWHVIENNAGDRYRVQIRDAKGNYKW